MRVTKENQRDSKDPRMWTTQDTRWAKREIGAIDKLKRELSLSAYRKHEAFLLWFILHPNIPKMWSAILGSNKLHEALQQFFSSIMSGQSGKPSQIIVCLMHSFFTGHSQRPLSLQPGGREAQFWNTCKQYWIKCFLL